MFEFRVDVDTMMRYVLAATMLSMVIGCVDKKVAATIPYERKVSCESSTVVGQRNRVSDRTLLFAETITSYAHYQNFLHFWIDRPLFFDRVLRPDLAKRFMYDTKESFELSQRDARKCGLDGFATFGNYGNRLVSFKEHCRWIEESGVPGLCMLPVMLYGESGMNGMPPLDKFVEFILYAQSTSVTPEIKGRKLIATYNTRCQNVETHRRICEELRKRVGNDRYWLVGDYENGAIVRLRRSFYRNGELNAAEKAKLVKMTTALRDVFHGLDLRPFDYLRTPDGPYTSIVDMSFFDKCVKPVLLDVYARPEYRDKLFGMYIIQGYVNCHSGMNHGEYGTESLRKMLRSAAALNPDFLVFFEWNEQNENTMFQPTVYSGQTIGRIVRSFADSLNGRDPSSYDGDDVSVPNVVLSHRVVFKPGERVRFEVLNIPCGVDRQKHEVQLSLNDEHGRVIVEFPKEHLKTDSLESITYALPGESFAVGASITPSLVVDGVRYAGFHPIRCDATVCRNYKDVRQSLRDCLGAERFSLRVEQISNGVYRCFADVSVKEDLTSLELVCNEDEIAAFDPAEEYDVSKCDIVKFGFSAAPGTTGGGEVELEFIGIDGLEIKQDWVADVNPGAIKWKTPKRAVLNTHWWTRPSSYFLKVPKGAAAGSEMTVHVLSGKHAGGRIVNVPLGRVLSNGAWAAEINPATGFRIDASRCDVLPDVPRSLCSRTVKWSCDVRTAEPNPTFHLRAISRSGKIIRSVPVRSATTPVEGFIDLPVFSEWQRKSLAVRVPCGQILDLVYRFTPECGDVLACSNPKYNATLGGSHAPGGVFTSIGLLSATPDRALAPKWRKEDGRWMLRFDGVNDYVSFPIETVPLGAFALKMELRPELCPTNMVLFRHGSGGRGTLALFVAGGNLYAIWPKRVYDGADRSGSMLRFETGLKVVSGEWNDIEVSYDCETLAFKVNGITKAYPMKERGYLFKPAAFGGHVNRGDIAPPGPLTWFKGDLRSLSIRHGNSQLSE